jgi:hypothetical protein
MGAWCGYVKPACCLRQCVCVVASNGYVRQQDHTVV